MTNIGITPRGPATFVCAAQALAINVFPVPGGPYNNTPESVYTMMQGITETECFSEKVHWLYITD